MTKTRKPLLSLIMPVYKAEKYLYQSVDSILAEELHDFELLLIDDGSPDNSGNICDAYARQDDRVRVFHQKNGGVSVARNRGLAEARGEYVGFVDSDDWIDSDLYYRVIEYMQKNSLDACIFGLKMAYADHEETFGTMSECRLSREDAIYEMFQGNVFQGWPWNKVYSRDLIIKHKFDERIHFCEDLLFNYFVMQDAMTIGYIPVTGYHYRQNSGSAVHSLHCEDTLFIDEAIQQANLPLSSKPARAIEDDMRKLQLDQLISCVKSGLVCDHKGFCRRVQRRLRHEFWDYQKLITYGAGKRKRIYAAVFASVPFAALPLFKHVLSLYSTLHRFAKPGDFKKRQYD